MLALCWIFLVPQVLGLTPEAGGQCRITLAAASVVMPTDCARFKQRSSISPVSAVDWLGDGGAERLFLHPRGDRLRIVLRRPVRSESLPIEESGDTIITTAQWRVGPIINGWPVIVETRTSRARQFNRVDRKADDVEVEEIRFVYLLGAYREVPTQ